MLPVVAFTVPMLPVVALTVPMLPVVALTVPAEMVPTEVMSLPPRSRPPLALMLTLDVVRLPLLGLTATRLLPVPAPIAGRPGSV